MKRPGPVESHIAPPLPPPKLSSYSLFPHGDTAALIAEAVIFTEASARKVSSFSLKSWAKQLGKLLASEGSGCSCQHCDS